MPDVGGLIRQLRAAGVDAWVLGSDGLDDPSLDAIGSDDPSILEKAAFGTPAPSQAGSAMEKFIKDCDSMGYPVDGMFHALGADVKMEIAYAVEATGGTDPVAIREALRSADSVSFKETSTHSLRAIPVIDFKDGVRVLLSYSIPECVPDWRLHSMTSAGTRISGAARYSEWSMLKARDLRRLPWLGRSRSRKFLCG